MLTLIIMGVATRKSCPVCGNKEGMEHARQIADLVSVIIDDVDRQEKQNVSTPTVCGSVAEELSKLAELKEKGILTDDEFKEQKKKLLG